MTKMYKAYAPASAANLSVGFDLLGAALKPIDGSLLGDEIVISANDTKGCDVSVTGRFAHKLPTDPKQNIVYQAYHTDCHETGTQWNMRKNDKISGIIGTAIFKVVFLDELRYNIL